MIGSSTESIIYAKDREGRMLYGNRALERLAGVSIADILGKTDTEWNPNVTEAEALQVGDRLVLASGQSHDLEEVFTGSGGVARHYQSLKSPLKVGCARGRAAGETACPRTRPSCQEPSGLVQSVVSLTRAETLAEFKTAVEGCIQSLGRAHSMLAASRWEGADLQRVLVEELAPYRSGEEALISLSGPPLLLKPAAAQSLALVIHELATNAVKHGALSVASGELDVRWEVRADDARGPLLCLRWEERGGPPVAPRSGSGRSGFGSRLIRSSIERQLAGTLRLDWAPGGLIAVMEVAIDRSVHQGGDEQHQAPSAIAYDNGNPAP